MKPFDLEAAKRGEPVQYRAKNGARTLARYIGADSKGALYFERLDIGGVVKVTNHERLCMAPRKRTVWVSFYRGAPRDFGLEAYVDNSEDESNRYATPNRIGNRAYPVEIDDFE